MSKIFEQFPRVGDVHYCGKATPILQEPAVIEGNLPEWIVVCYGCSLSTFSHHSPEEAISAWNSAQPKFASGPWIKISKQPTAGRSYLIHASYDGIETQDVAFYNGRRPDGSHWWTLGKIEIEQSCILLWAELYIPEEKC